MSSPRGITAGTEIRILVDGVEVSKVVVATPPTERVSMGAIAYKAFSRLFGPVHESMNLHPGVDYSSEWGLLASEIIAESQSRAAAKKPMSTLGAVAAGAFCEHFSSQNMWLARDYPRCTIAWNSIADKVVEAYRKDFATGRHINLDMTRHAENAYDTYRGAMMGVTPNGGAMPTWSQLSYPARAAWIEALEAI